MWDGVPIRPRMLIVLICANALAAGCITPVSKGYEIHTADLSCDEANRQVYAALRDMDMEITSFTPAKPGQTGHGQACAAPLGRRHPAADHRRRQGQGKDKRQRAQGLDDRERTVAEGEHMQDRGRCAQAHRDPPPAAAQQPNAATAQRPGE